MAQATAHTFILLCALLLEIFLRCSHRRRQQKGYLRFYRRTRHLLSIPFQASGKLMHEADLIRHSSKHR